MVPKNGHTILLAEDEDGVRRFIGDVLRSKGYTVLEAANGVQAVSVAESYRGPIHLLLSDAIMPELGGVDLAERFARLRPGAAVLLMSGYLDRKLRGPLANALLEKPFTPADLLKRVREQLTAV